MKKKSKKFVPLQIRVILYYGLYIYMQNDIRQMRNIRLTTLQHVKAVPENVFKCAPLLMVIMWA